MDRIDRQTPRQLLPASRATRAPTRHRVGRTVIRHAKRAIAGLGLVALCACTAPAPRESQEASGARSGEPGVAAALPTDAMAAHATSGTRDATAGGDAPTLYAELGDAEGVAALSEQFIREIAADDRIRGHYRDSDMGRFHRMFQQQLCERAGGNCTYTGDDMRRTHGGMNITPTEFNAIVEALMRAMDARELPVPTQNRLLAIYAPMREDIIDR